MYMVTRLQNTLKMASLRLETLADTTLRVQINVVVRCMTGAITANLFVMEMIQTEEATLSKLRRVAKFRFHQYIIPLCIIIKLGPNPSELPCFNILVIITFTLNI
jgi:hypothetical protein